LIVGGGFVVRLSPPSRLFFAISYDCRGLVDSNSDGGVVGDSGGGARWGVACQVW